MDLFQLESKESCPICWKVLYDLNCSENVYVHYILLKLIQPQYDLHELLIMALDLK